MSSAYESAGAAREPSEYATLVMDRAITGLWTQRSPLRDANVPYLYEKFYSAGRFDSMIDGLNREISAALTWKRAPGSSVYNSNTFPGCNSFYPWSFIQNNVEQVRVIYDGKDGNIYDATAGQKTTLFAKSAGAGPAYFQGVNTELFFGDGVDLKKILRSAKTWSAANTYTVGDFIIDSNGRIQSFQAQAVNLTITSIQNVQKTMCGNTSAWFWIITFSSNVPIVPSNYAINFSGITHYTLLNGTNQIYRNLPQGWNFNLNANQIAIASTSGIAYPDTADTGTAAMWQQYNAQGVALTGVSGGTQPTWSGAQYGTTQDGTVGTGVTWKCYGTPVQNWTPAAPVSAPTIVPGNSVNYWRPNTIMSFAYYGATIIDANGQYQVLVSYGGQTGNLPPIWSTKLGGLTQNDGSCTWRNIGTPASWVQNWQYNESDVIILDSNGNLQWATGLGSGPITAVFLENGGTGFSNNDICGIAGGNGGEVKVTSVTSGVVGSITLYSPGSGYTSSGSVATYDYSHSGSGMTITTTAGYQTGASQPTWATTLGATTVDNQITWTCLGPGTQLINGNVQYVTAYHSIDGSVSTASPPLNVLYGALGPAGGLLQQVTFTGSSDTQVDQIYLFRTAQGQATLVFCDSIPNPGASSVLYYDVIADTSTVGNQALVPTLQAPIADFGNAPPKGMIAYAFHLQRVWGIVGNNVYYSATPFTAIAGNSYTQFPPLNYIPFPEQIIKLRPITLANGGILAYGTKNVYVILGTGTASNPFYATVYMANVGLLGYWAEDVVGTTPWVFTSKNKFMALDPGGGYKEYGYPIGDQFLNVTTGMQNTGAIYSAAGTYVSWHEQSSGDTGVYVADGAYGWFRLSPVSAPEDGFVWSPRRIIQGGTSAVQSVEVSPGITNLLIAPASSGPILKRDAMVSADNGTAFESYMTMGNIVLCQSGEVAEIAHIALKSTAINGATKPVVSILLGETSASAAMPFDVLSITSADPPNLPASTTLWSDRYTALQNGKTPKCDNFQLNIDYGAQAYADELLNFSIYGAKHAERRQQ